MFQAWCVIALVLVASSDLWRAGARAEFTATATTYDLLSLFMARCGPGWVTGDGGFTARLPSGDIAWLFGDSGLGRIAPGSQLIESSFAMVVGTTLAIQNASNLFAPEFVSYFHEGTSTVARTTYKGFPYDPVNCPKEGYQTPAPVSSLFPCTTSTGCFYWPEGAIVEYGKLVVFLVNPNEHKTYLSTLPVGNFTAPPSTPAPTPNNGVQYGHELTNDGLYTYIYGARDETAGNSDCHGDSCMHLARAPIGFLSLPGFWEFFAGTTANGQPKWSPNPADTRAIVPAGKGPAYSVTKMFGCGTMPTCYVLLQSFWYGAIIAQYSANPWGPFSAAKAVHFAFGTSGDTVPEAGMTFGSQRGQFVTYSAQLHEEWPPTTDGYLVGYSLNSQSVNPEVPLDCFIAHPEDPICEWQRANMYVPRFIRVKFGW
jgi:hypothetical protein